MQRHFHLCLLLFKLFARAEKTDYLFMSSLKNIWSVLHILRSGDNCITFSNSLQNRNFPNLLDKIFPNKFEILISCFTYIFEKICKLHDHFL